MPLLRPITWFDLETTGIEKDSRIVEIAIVRLNVDGSETAFRTLVNPTIPIPPEASLVHGITDFDVKDAPTFAALAPRLINAFREVDFGGYNIARFDIEVIGHEFRRAGLSTEVPAGHLQPRIIDPYFIWTKSEPRSLSDAVVKFLDREHEGAHTAMDDLRATIAVFERMSVLWGLPDDLTALHELQFPANPNAIDGGARFVFKDGVPTLNFGPKKGTPMHLLDRGFYGWILRSDFTSEVKALARNALGGIYPVAPKEEDDGELQGSVDKSDDGGSSAPAGPLHLPDTTPGQA